MSQSLTKKDILSISFSAIAIVLSVVAAYFNFFRQVDDVQVRVADFQRGAKIVTRLAFINRGTQPALVTAAEWVAAWDRDFKGDRFGNLCESPAGTFPFVLDRGQMKLVEVTSSNEAIEEGSVGKTGPLYYGITIASINSRGVEHGARLTLAKLELEDSKIVGSRSERPIAPLFGNTEVFFRTPW